MNEKQRQALIELLAPLVDPFEVFTASDGHPAIRAREGADIAAALVDGPLAPVITVLTHAEEFYAGDTAAFTQAYSALDPAWLGEP